jgi:hypothetical protein
MPILKFRPGITLSLLSIVLVIPLTINCIVSCDSFPVSKSGKNLSGSLKSSEKKENPEGYNPVYDLLILPKSPVPGKPFRVFATGGEDLRKSLITVSGPDGTIKSEKSIHGDELPYWRIDDFKGGSAGKYTITLTEDNRIVSTLELTISQAKETKSTNVVWKTLRGWDSGTEAIYSAWINALFHDCDENASWSSLHEVVRNKNQNFLYNYLSLGEDDPDTENKLIMQPDCADNPFFLRAYFAWKLGLPFGYHICDRGSIGHSPKTGQWITNGISSSRTQPVLAFNAFLRRVMNDVQSGTARTALDDENSDYYPVSLERANLRPGIVFADPYGHTLVIVGWIPQTKGHPGLLLSVDAQPDGTVGIKRFWKGNFLFNTSGVIGEPGFKAFRPVSLNKGVLYRIPNKSLTASAGYVPFSLQQRKMKSEVFYHTMERLINPKPLDPEDAMVNLIQALHEQLQVRVTSVSNGEAYFKSHQGAVISMPSSAAAIFQSGGQWENFSTPNRDLRLLIAMDAILDFPDLVVRSPGDFEISGSDSGEEIKKKLTSLLDKKASDLSITYTRTNGSPQKLTVGEILKRRDAFEMAYNPNDGVEIRWGAPENSEERSTCHRHAPSGQIETMRSVRTWFHKRLHPPT